MPNSTVRRPTLWVHSPDADRHVVTSRVRCVLAAAGAAVVALCFYGLGALAAGSPSASPAPSPSPTPTATPTPVLQLGGSLTFGSFSTGGRNAVGALDTATGVDRATRADLTNALITPTVNLGDFHASSTAGFYNLPAVGFALNPIDQTGANTTLFTPVPLYYLSYTPKGHFSFYVGKLPTELGQESMFTYQNFNIQRGFGWAVEPLVSRGIRAAYANGPWTVQLEYNDGYYGGGTSSAFEGSIAFAATGTQTFSLAIIDPRSDSPPNPTASVANKREEDLMYAGTFGKFVLTPYLLWVQSPAVTSLGYGNENAFAGSLLGAYNLSPRYSLGFRYESIKNASSTTDANANADLIGYGPGSGATSVTLTPTFKAGLALLRFEWSSVDVTNLKPGLGFNASGTGTHQSRYALELGIAH